MQAVLWLAWGTLAGIAKTFHRAKCTPRKPQNGLHGPPSGLRACLAASALILWAIFAAAQNATPPVPSLLNPDQNPDLRCAGCHADIYRRYQLTAMAGGSGDGVRGLKGLKGLLAGELHDRPSAVDYRVFERDGSAWMSFHRDPSSPKGELAGERQLQYFLGSGRHGRTFLYELQGLWFELPINYYTQRGDWEMAPNYENSTYMPAPLPVDPNCLHCHASGVPAEVLSPRNRFAGAPFTQGGVGCNACHGDPAQHLAHAGHAAITNPDKLPPQQRDSACIQCHLEGDAVVYRPGRSLSQFRAGDKLEDIAIYFVYASQLGGGARATSQYEALLQSACKRASGDRLTCTTCHDPHGSPSRTEQVAFYRGKCLTCHTGSRFATGHHPEQPDCASCHMPARDTTDISHAQVTDHNIERLPAVGDGRHGDTLVPVGGFAVGDRDYGLAYAQLAQHGNRKAGEQALVLLTRAEKAGASDAQLHLNLGFLEQISGRPAEARAEYGLALQKEPQNLSAQADLAVLAAASGDVGESLRLLQGVVTADPSQTSAGLNLAFLQCSLGQMEQAHRTLAVLRTMDPDSPQLREFASTGRYGGQRCLGMGR